MKNQLKQFRVKKRYLAAGIIALELASLPAAAQVVHSVVFEARPRVVAVEVPNEIDGYSSFLVTSNAPFAVTSDAVIGEVEVAVKAKGNMNGTAYGGNAQMPGDASVCGDVHGIGPETIYRATQKVAAKPGPTITQAILVEFTYAPEAKPEFIFLDDDETPPAPAGSCSSRNS